MNLVLIHGYNSSPATWKGVATELEESGHKVIIPKLSPEASLKHRSGELVEKIKSMSVGKWETHSPIHLIGHSMGGLNARDIAKAASVRSHRLNIVSVTTLGTPHRGAASATIGGLMRVYYWSSPATLSLNGNSAAKFNQSTPNNPNVLYLSWAGRVDEIVPVSSATWGHYLGSVPVNHGDLTKTKILIDAALYILEDWENDNTSSSSCFEKIKKCQTHEAQRGADHRDLLQSISGLQLSLLAFSDSFRASIFG